jgi:hypothetical protein
MKLVVYSSRTRDFDGLIFVVRTVNNNVVESLGEWNYTSVLEKSSVFWYIFVSQLYKTYAMINIYVL